MIIYSDHAKEKMIERNINENLVESVLWNPNKISNSKNNRKIAEKRIGKLNLRVVYTVEKENYIIITLYYRRLKP